MYEHGTDAQDVSKSNLLVGRRRRRRGCGGIRPPPHFEIPSKKIKKFEKNQF
jgi:hypothetical protein